MARIETEIWAPTPGNPRTLSYAGQRTAQEVFAELEYQLQSTGMLPDEYFMLDHEWENGREIPKGAGIFCTADYGSSEGIYLDIYLKWHDEQTGSVTKSFITGKTLGETASDLDRMHLTASAVMQAFHADGVHARYIRMGESVQPDGGVLHLNGAERRLLIESLMDRHSRLSEETHAVERLLRRAAGSITEYINEMGRRPVQMDDFDAAVLAIHDGNMQAFDEARQSVPERTGELLVYAARRPGYVGWNMTGALLMQARNIPNDLYFEACKQAIGTGDYSRVLILAERAGTCRAEKDLTIYGDMISRAIYDNKHHIARELLKACDPNQIAAANPYLLVQVLDKRDYDMARKLVENGIDANSRAWDIVLTLAYRNDLFYFGHLLEHGMDISNGNYSAMDACIKTGSTEQAKLLLDRGMDFEKYTGWAEQYSQADRSGEAFAAVKDYWEQSSTQQQGGPVMSSMA